MLPLSRLMALVVLIASPWEVTSVTPQDPDVYFGCHKNVDALCSRGLLKEQIVVMWAVRVTPGTRDYKCWGGFTPQCCKKGTFKLNDEPYHTKVVPKTAADHCAHGGQ
ncbi:hypothetical protein Pst134EA_026613 [Puccinia striiformis f. sp. tritici]|uniref:hypothetical protein n=1 Tax=Puccinia striiformis f. sp. tritici TaxID=168172 RepID=UPI002007A392|nr:hypothetical protein Pst134EA_026613 [Puccinia striiformis f. sp. tritici]KAH9449900.1 hypothetical protein Pst134EA_026613 [Puccinia striiformis f. sp. tritici]KAI9628461.1 hypothetical protein H4Q26_018062 [Puccinia striiformis f. sp. tritici PST-130]